MLEDVGFSRDQAETSIKILVEMMEGKLATKQDIADLRLATQHDIAELKHEIRLAQAELKVQMGAMLTVAVALVAAIQKFF